MRRPVAYLAIALLVAACAPVVDGINLDGTTWRATDVAGSTPVDGREPWVSFDGSNITGSAGCNGYGATNVSIAGNHITIDGFAMTAALCTPASETLMRVEERFAAALREATGIHVTESGLEIATTMGDLVFERIEGPAPTPG